MPTTANATLVSIDFESFLDLDDLSSLSPVSGVTFTSATVLTTTGAGGCCLNDLLFPPHSGVNAAADVLFDLTDPFNPVISGGGPMFLTFSSPVSSFTAFFTYSLDVNPALTIQAFNDLAGTVLVASVSTASDNNLGSSEPLGVTAPIIRSLLITGDPGAGPQTVGSFIIDDITIETTSVVPEPRLLLMLGLAAVMFVSKRHFRRGRFER
jgi:hypothetical protein